jgi:hypothetical protein
MNPAVLELALKKQRLQIAGEGASRLRHVAAVAGLSGFPRSTPARDPAALSREQRKKPLNLTDQRLLECWW